MNMRWLNFPFQPNANIETTWGHQHWINATLFCQHWNNVDKHTSAQLSFSIKFQRWNNVGSSTLNRRNSINFVSKLFCQHWNNVDKCTSAQLSILTKYQRWNKVHKRWWSSCFNVDSTLICLLGYDVYIYIYVFVKSYFFSSISFFFNLWTTTSTCTISKVTWRHKHQ